MKLFLYRILGWFDRTISHLFWLTSMGDGDQTGTSQWTYYIHRGRRIAIVGTDGRIHTVTGYHAVNHYYRDGKLVRRMRARKDLQPGERLATVQEISNWQREQREWLATAHGISC